MLIITHENVKLHIKEKDKITISIYKDGELDKAILVEQSYLLQFLSEWIDSHDFIASDRIGKISDGKSDKR